MNEFAKMYNEEIFMMIPTRVYLSVINDEKLTWTAQKAFLMIMSASHINKDYTCRLSAQNLADMMKVSLSAAKKSLSLLVKNGYIKRTAMGQDRRNPHRKEVSLTEPLVTEGMRAMFAQHFLKKNPYQKEEADVNEINDIESEWIDETSKITTTLKVAQNKDETARKEQKTSNVKLPKGGYRSKDAYTTELISAPIEKISNEMVSEDYSKLIDNEDVLSYLGESTIREDEPTMGENAPGLHLEPISSIDHVESSYFDVSSSFKADTLLKLVKEKTSSVNPMRLAREVIWSMENGSLKKHSNLVKARNIALKLMEEGKWKTPQGMM